MTAVQISIQDNGTFAGLARMQNLAPLTNALIQAGEHMRTQQQRYPTQWSHRHIPEWTPKQRAYVMMAIKQGIIVIPRTRTMALANSWVVVGQGLSVTVGTAHPQAPLMKSERMTMYHRITGWESAPVTALNAAPRCFEIFNAGVAQWVG